MKFIDTYAQAIGRHSVLLFYGISDYPDNIDAYRYRIYRGKHFDKLNLIQDNVKENHFMDNDVVSESPYKLIFYKVELYGVNDNIVYCTSGAIRINNQSNDLKAAKIARNYNLVLNKKNGSDALYYVRRKSGIKCPVCYDKDINGSVVGNCENCGGTGIIDGYYTPVKLKAMFSNKTGVIAPGLPVSDGMPGSVVMGNFPIAMEKDIIYEIPRNRLWRVQRIESLEHNSNIYAQRITATSVPNISSLFDRIVKDIDLNVLYNRSTEADGSGVTI